MTEIARLPGALAVKLSCLRSFASDLDELSDFVVALDNWGVHQLVGGEHLLQVAQMSHPGGIELGGAPRSSTAPDTMIVFAALAGQTTTIRFGTSVLIAALHEPVLLARQAASLDVLSRGRFDLGLGGGWLRAEFDAVGVPFEERFARLEETVRVCKVLWTDEPSTFHGKWTHFDEVVSMPPPATEGGVPVWIGGRATRSTARRVAELAAGWVASETATGDEIAQAVVLIREACSRIDRSPDVLGIRATLPTDRQVGTRPLKEKAAWLVESARRHAEIGVTHHTLSLDTYAESASEAEDLIGCLL